MPRAYDQPRIDRIRYEIANGGTCCILVSDYANWWETIAIIKLSTSRGRYLIPRAVVSAWTFERTNKDIKCNRILRVA